MAAYEWLLDETGGAFEREVAKRIRTSTYFGQEIDERPRRLALMNLYLHQVEPRIKLGDSIYEAPSAQRFDVILTNPPFGTKKGGGRPSRTDFSITADTSNKQLAFVEHVVRALKLGGRAAVVVPDNVLFEDNAGQRLRTWMMELCDVHTLLRLPTGIFYAQGVKTNVLFFTRGKTDKGNTRGIWVYDMRANMDTFGKTRPLTASDFKEFELCFGRDPLGRSKRKDRGEEGRFRFFTRQQITHRGENLDIAWLRDTSNDPEDEMTEPGELLAAISKHLKRAQNEIEALSEELAAPAPR